MCLVEESFKYYLIYFFNEVVKFKMVGMDVVYVYLVEKYYVIGQVFWMDEEQLEKIIDNVKMFKLLLIGKIVFDIQL